MPTEAEQADKAVRQIELLLAQLTALQQPLGTWTRERCAAASEVLRWLRYPGEPKPSCYLSVIARGIEVRHPQQDKGSR
jgi:hypothetical protein